MLLSIPGNILLNVMHCRFAGYFCIPKNIIELSYLEIVAPFESCFKALLGRSRTAFSLRLILFHDWFKTFLSILPNAP